MKIDIYKGLLFFLLFILTGINSYSIDYISIDGGALLILNADENSAPHPLMPFIGASFNILPEEKPLLLEAGMHFFATQYVWNGEMAVPAEIETANSILTLGMLLEIRFGYLFTISDLFKLGGTVGIANTFRFPIKAYDSGSNTQGDVIKDLMKRFFYPEVELTFRWRLREKLGLSLGIRYMIPFFHIWDGSDLPFYDQMGFAAVVGVQMYFSKDREVNE